MTTSTSKEDLPPHWMVKTSRRHPSIFYYANVKTGQSTWKHPSLLKESELKNFTKKKLGENSPELKIDTSVEEQQLKSSRKAKFIPIISAASVRNEQNLNDDKGDFKDLKTKQISNDNTGYDKSNPIKFTIKKKNVLSSFSKTESSKKKSVPLHPSILLAQKIATRNLHLNVKRKVECDEEDKETTRDEVHSAKRIKKTLELLVTSTETDILTTTKDHMKTREHKAEQNKKTLELLVTSTETDTLTTTKDHMKTREHKVEQNKSITKGGKKESPKKRRCKKKQKHVKSIPVERTDEKKKKDKHIEDTKSKENQMYNEFITRNRNLWKRKIYGFQESESEKTFKPELYRDEEHVEILPDKPKEQASGSSTQVTYMDSLKVSNPVLLPAENTIYPKVIDMEIDKQELNMEIANFRGSASYSSMAISEDLPNSSTCHSSASLYFVVDTNVLIADIDFLHELKSSVIDGRESVVLVPYVALQEMDGLKRSASIGKACQAAVRWCNQHFEAQHPRVQGQTYSNYRTTVEENKKASADDLVRDCCLLLAREGLDVCLLTNDINLRNKALMSNLSAISAKNLKNKLKKLSVRHEDLPPRPEVESKCQELQMKDICFNEPNKDVNDAYEQESSYHQATPSNVVPKQLNDSSDQEARRASCSMSAENVLLKRITTSLHHTLSNIIQDVMKEIFDDLWLTVIKYKPPWSLKELFACWEKHWIATMIDKFPTQVKELLTQINKSLTTNQGDVQKLLSRVQQLYSYFKSSPYNKYILPVKDSGSVGVDMPEEALSTSTCSIPPSTKESVTAPHRSCTTDGVINVEKMINQVGAHITHFVALVLTTFGMQHNLQSLPNISASETLTPDNARTSGINLHKVIMNLGTTITRCLNEKTSSALQELGHMLVNFWSEAHLPIPHLPFMECDLRQFVESPSSAQYLKCVLQELERLVQQLTSVLATF